MFYGLQLSTSSFSPIWTLKRVVLTFYLCYSTSCKLVTYKTNGCKCERVLLCFHEDGVLEKQSWCRKFDCKMSDLFICSLKVMLLKSGVDLYEKGCKIYWQLFPPKWFWMSLLIYIIQSFSKCIFNSADQWSGKEGSLYHLQR